MTIRDVYIGELGQNGALDWGGDPNIANIPRRIGPFIPAHGARRHPYDLLHEWIDADELPGAKIDWGAYGAIVGVADINRFLAACYDTVPPYVSEFVATLDPEKKYALVASEL